MRTPEALDFIIYGVRISLYRLAAGEGIERHRHRNFAHKIIVVDGAVALEKELHKRTCTAPCELTIEPGLEHQVVAVTDAIVLSVFDER